MSLLARLRARFVHSQGITIAPLLPRHSADVAHIQAGGGFARNWSPQECEALLTDRAVHADGGFRGRHLACAVLSRVALDEAEILTIVTAPNARRAGAAAQVLAVHMAHLAARGAKMLFLEVDAQNLPALALYRRFGFQQVGERPGYYPRADGTRATALVLRRQL
jgi:[ribosomal protein S18]-alanine N-acetyltransferase